MSWPVRVRKVGSGCIRKVYHLPHRQNDIILPDAKAHPMFASFPRLVLEQLDGRDLMSVTFAGANGVFAAGFRPEAAGTHALYQDITIPVNQSAGGRPGTLVGIAGQTDQPRDIVIDGDVNAGAAHVKKAVLFVRKSGGGPEDTY